MGELIVLNRSGDLRLEWDPRDGDSTRRAREEFERLISDGYEVYKFTGDSTKGKRVTAFTPRAGKLVAAPGAKRKQDRVQGTRTRAMAGGPKLQTARLR